MRKIIPVCQKNGNKQQIELGSTPLPFPFLLFLTREGGVVPAKLGGVLMKAGNWVERGAAIFVKNPE